MLSENQECIEFAIYLKRRGVDFIHVPNGGLRGAREAATFRAMGVSPGFPDYIIFSPPADLPTWRSPGVALEMKRRSGGKVSAVQGRWLNRLSRLGWHTIVANGYKHAIEQLEDLGY